MFFMRHLAPGQDNFVEKDIKFTCLISEGAPAVVILNSDYLYLGFWYYLILPALVIGINFLLKIGGNICSGMALALQMSFFVFFYWQHQINQGLLGLIHVLFLLPGAAVSSIVGLVLRKRNNRLAALSGFAYGFCSFATGAAAGMIIYLFI